MKDQNDTKTVDWVGFQVGDNVKTCRFDRAEVVEVLPNKSLGLRYKNTVLYYSLKELKIAGIEKFCGGAA